MQQNPIPTLTGQTEDMRRYHYNDLELHVQIDKRNVKMCGVFGSQRVAPTLDVGEREIGLAIRAAARITSSTIER
jgi:hypothetical protein